MVGTLAVDPRGDTTLKTIAGLLARVKALADEGLSTRMGSGQAVARNFTTRVNLGASDPRKDGAAIAQLIPFR